MAREIIVNLDGEVSKFGLARLNREKLYGKKRRVIVDQLDQECDTAMLTRDGAALIPRGGIANLYVNEDFDVVERGGLQAVNENLDELPPIKSTLGVEQGLSEVELTRVLEHITTAVYQLEASELSDTLRAGLSEGKVYESVFAYRSGFDASPIFLLQNEHGVWALVGRPSGFDYIEREVKLDEPEDEEDPFDDDLDFSMM